MTDNRPTVQLFARGWNYTAWQGVFYPEDLPADWRLSYYANEFPGLLLPQTEWQRHPPETLLAWLEELDEGFQLYLELAVEADWQRLAPLAGRLAGVVLQAGVAMAPIEALGVDGYRLLRPGERAVAGELVAFCLESGGPQTPYQLRDLLESVAAQAPVDRPLPLFLCGEPPALEQLRQLRQLAELMGLA